MNDLHIQLLGEHCNRTTITHAKHYSVGSVSDPIAAFNFSLEVAKKQLGAGFFLNCATSAANGNLGLRWRGRPDNERNQEDVMVDVEDTYQIIDDIELPPAKVGAARPKKEKGVPLGFDSFSDKIQRLFFTPSLTKGEDPGVYAELYRLVQEVVSPKDVWDQMMVADITNHFWEQQRYRRCTGTIINSKRRAALIRILRVAIGLNDVDAETVADTYFGVERLEEREVTDYSTQAPIPKTRADVVALLEKHGFDETAIERVAVETSVAALADLESLALKHEIRREAIFRKLERRRKKRHAA